MRDGWTVQRVHPYQALKPYRCPACGNEIPSGEGHVVAWQHDDVADRRHWHTHCWRLAGRTSY